MKPDWTVRASDGPQLGVKVTEPGGSPIADVLLLHAMMVDARSLDRPPGQGLASALAAAGFRVHRADLRGRGMSDRPADWSYDDLVLRDLPALVGALERPWIVGHSLGGHVGLAAWASGAVVLRGWVGLGANVWRPSLEPSVGRRAAKAAAMGLAAISLGAFGGLAARRVGFGSVDEAGTYGADLLGFWTGDRWASRAGRDWTADLPSVRGPALSVLSHGDRLLGHPVGAAAWVAPVPGVEVWALRDGEHGMPRAPDHMGLACEGGSAPLWCDIAAWMADRSPR